MEETERHGSASSDLNQPVDASTSSEALGNYFWWHSIRLDDGRVTPGRVPLELMDQACELTFRPVNIVGKSVLDVGASNGGFSIAAVRRGARRVVALDHTAWNNPAAGWRTTFEIAKNLCNAAIEAVDQDLDAPQLCLAHLGSFDIVLFLGVFNYLTNPLAALKEVAPLTREVLILEVRVEENAGLRPAMVFCSGDDPTGDGVNWWWPNRRFIEDFLRLLGFGRIDYSVGSDPSHGIFHAFRTAPYTSEIDWLPMMSVGPSGRRLAGGEVTNIISQSGGHVAYGPYVTLLPGVYMLTAVIAAEASGNAGWQAMLEVVGPDFVPMACGKFRLSAGLSRLRLKFEIERSEVPDKSLGPLEFRIACQGATLFQVHAVKTGPYYALMDNNDLPDATMDTG